MNNSKSKSGEKSWNCLFENGNWERVFWNLLTFCLRKWNYQISFKHSIMKKTTARIFPTFLFRKKNDAPSDRSSYTITIFFEYIMQRFTLHKSIRNSMRIYLNQKSKIKTEGHKLKPIQFFFLKPKPKTDRYWKYWMCILLHHVILTLSSKSAIVY